MCSRILFVSISARYPAGAEILFPDFVSGKLGPYERWRLVV